MRQMKKRYKLHVVERGKGRPVILLHGVMSTHRYWSGVADLLEDERRLLMPDLLGFGASPKPRRAAYSLEQFIDCLEYTFDQYKFKQRPILAGHSMGAAIALRWARLQPERFSAVVLSSPLFFERDLLHQQLATIALEGKWLTSKVLAKSVSYAMSLAGLVPMRVARRFAGGRPVYVLEDVTSQRFHVFRKILKGTYFRDDVFADLESFPLPIRLLVGDQDWIANHVIKDLEALCGRNKQCHIKVLPGSHQILLEHPEKVADTILSV